MALRARKLSGAFEKRAIGPKTVFRAAPQLTDRLEKARSFSAVHDLSYIHWQQQNSQSYLFCRHCHHPELARTEQLWPDSNADTPPSLELTTCSGWPPTSRYTRLSTRQTLASAVCVYGKPTRGFHSVEKSGGVKRDDWFVHHQPTSDARKEFGAHKRRVWDARGAAESNCSYTSVL